MDKHTYGSSPAAETLAELLSRAPKPWSRKVSRLLHHHRRRMNGVRWTLRIEREDKITIWNVLTTEALVTAFHMFRGRTDPDVLKIESFLRNTICAIRTEYVTAYSTSYEKKKPKPRVCSICKDEARPWYKRIDVPWLFIWLFIAWYAGSK